MDNKIYSRYTLLTHILLYVGKYTVEIVCDPFKIELQSLASTMKLNVLINLIISQSLLVNMNYCWLI